MARGSFSHGSGWVGRGIMNSTGSGTLEESPPFGNAGGAENNFSSYEDRSVGCEGAQSSALYSNKHHSQ